MASRCLARVTPGASIGPTTNRAKMQPTSSAHLEFRCAQPPQGRGATAQGRGLATPTEQGRWADQVAAASRWYAHATTGMALEPSSQGRPKFQLILAGARELTARAFAEWVSGIKIAWGMVHPTNQFSFICDGSVQRGDFCLDCPHFLQSRLLSRIDLGSRLGCGGCRCFAPLADEPSPDGLQVIEMLIRQSRLPGVYEFTIEARENHCYKCPVAGFRRPTLRYRPGAPTKREVHLSRPGDRRATSRGQQNCRPSRAAPPFRKDPGAILRPLISVVGTIRFRPSGLESPAMAGASGVWRSHTHLARWTMWL